MSGTCSDGILREVLRQLGQSLTTPPDGQAWSQEQWCEAFSFLFLAAPGSRHALLEHQDDMLWFVTAEATRAQGTSPVSLRRNTTDGLPPELHPGGSSFASVAWDLSVQLNLVVQAKYVLTVVQCRQDALVAVAQGHATSGHLPAGGSDHHQQQQQRHPGTVVAQRRVYASPMVADVNLEDAKSGKPPRPSYPDVCFAVDNFEDAFQDMVLSAPTDCYCVMLHVHASGPIAQPHAPPAAGGASATASSASEAAARAAPAHPPAERRATLFSAYVTHDQVTAYIATARGNDNARSSLLYRLLLGSRSDFGRQKRVVMTGPAGVGRAEAVAAAVRQPDEQGGAGPQVTPMQLSLMWMSLPVSALAKAVLQFGCGEG